MEEEGEGEEEEKEEEEEEEEEQSRPPQTNVEKNTRIYTHYCKGMVSTVTNLIQQRSPAEPLNL